MPSAKKIKAHEKFGILNREARKSFSEKMFFSKNLSEAKVDPEDTSIIMFKQREQGFEAGAYKAYQRSAKTQVAGGQHEQVDGPR